MIAPAGPYTWLFLDLNSYFASVEQQVEPSLRGRPIAVVPLNTDATCAIAASYEAKAFGIKTGTPIYEAKKMCPELICVQARHSVYVEYHHKILEEIEHHVPIHQIASIDEVACELTASQCTEEAAVALSKRIKQGLYQNVGPMIRCSIGLASNRYLAKVGTNLQKPNGLVVMREGELPAKLFSYPINSLPGIGYGMEHRLRMSGVGSMEQLFSLSPKQMRYIWHSVEGERFWYKLRGHELRDRSTQRRTVGHSHVLDPSWRPRDRARVIAQRLLIKAASRLRRLEFYAKHMVLSVRIENGPRLKVVRAFYRACDNFTLLGIMHAMWGELLYQYPYARIKKVSVTLFDLVPASALQEGLFDAEDGAIQSRQKYERVSKAMDSLNAKYGRDTVVLGASPQQTLSFSGTKVAFTRIPEHAEFHE